MESIDLYEKLENDFITSEMSDENWAEQMSPLSEFLSENFKRRSMGLVCDFAKEINNVYTAVFPSKKVMQRILDDEVEDAMLFIHHPMIWDIRKAPEVFQQMDKDLLQKFKNRRISIYNLHVPLDSFGEYSTSVTLAKELGIKPEKPFFNYFGALVGIFGKTDITTVQDLKNKFEEVVGHKVNLYNYGENEIKKGIVAVVAGAGNSVDTIKDVEKNGVNTIITGISVKNNYTEEAHNFAEKNKINILGGTHYSNEKFACMSMVNYFKKKGLYSEFIEDEPIMEDL